jgi:SnoaL-like domain
VTLPTDDRLALRELVEAYGMAVDALDAEWFGSLWTPDAVLAVHDATGETRRWEGDEIAGMVAGVGRYLRTLHFVGNHQTAVEGSVVTGRTYCFAHHLLADPAGSDDRARDRVLAIRYDDRYARGTDSAWRFARRDVRMLWRTHHDVELLGYRA